MTQFVLTPRAKQDVNDIWDYIADDSIESADRVLAALESASIDHRREELAVIDSLLHAAPQWARRIGRSERRGP